MLKPLYWHMALLAVIVVYGVDGDKLDVEARTDLQVDLYESGTIAIVEAVSPELGNRVQRVRVQLPGTSQELLTKFREKKVDFAAHTATEDGGAVFLNLLGTHLFTWIVQILCCWPLHNHVSAHSRIFIVCLLPCCF